MELCFVLTVMLMHAELPATAGQPATKSLGGWPQSISWAGAAASAGLSATAPTAWPAADAQQSSDKLVQALIAILNFLQGRLTSHSAA